MCMVFPAPMASKKSDDVITLRFTYIQAAGLHWENHGQGIQFLLVFLPAKKSDYLMTYIHKCIHMYICTYISTSVMK